MTIPIRPDLEAGLWYFYYLTQRGRAGLTANRSEIAKVIWKRNSPNWGFDEPTFQQAAGPMDNPDYVEVVLHSYRHRLGAAAGSPAYADIEAKLAAQPTILCQPSRWTVWQTGTSRPATALRQRIISAVHVPTTKYPTPVTISPRKHPTPSRAPCWKSRNLARRKRYANSE